MVPDIPVLPDALLSGIARTDDVLYLIKNVFTGLLRIQQQDPGAWRVTLSGRQSRSHDYGLNKPSHFHPEVEIEIAQSRSPESKQGVHMLLHQSSVLRTFE